MNPNANKRKTLYFSKLNLEMSMLHRSTVIPPRGIKLKKVFFISHYNKNQYYRTKFQIEITSDFLSSVWTGTLLFSFSLMLRDTCDLCLTTTSSSHVFSTTLSLSTILEIFFRMCDRFANLNYTKLFLKIHESVKIKYSLKNICQISQSGKSISCTYITRVLLGWFCQCFFFCSHLAIFLIESHTRSQLIHSV